MRQLVIKLLNIIDARCNHEVSYAVFQAIRTVRVECRDINLFTALNKEWHLQR